MLKNKPFISLGLQSLVRCFVMQRYIALTALPNIKVKNFKNFLKQRLLSLYKYKKVGKRKLIVEFMQKIKDWTF